MFFFKLCKKLTGLPAVQTCCIKRNSYVTHTPVQTFLERVAITKFGLRIYLPQNKQAKNKKKQTQNHRRINI